MSLGDSKTAANPWVASLTARAATATTVPWKSYNGGVGGATVATALAAMDGILAAFPADGAGGDYRVVTMNWGVNDGCSDTATWETNYLAIIDKVHAKAPAAQVYLMRPWKRGFGACTAALHTSIDTIVAARATFAHVGPDEAVWLEGGDDGVTNSTDGTHYSAAGQIAADAAWVAVPIY